MPTIITAVIADGKVVLSVNGAPGGTCLSVTAPILAALGIVEEQTPTAEMFEAPLTEQQMEWEKQ